MKLSQLLNNNDLSVIEKKISTECVEFLTHSNGCPLYKTVSNRDSDEIKLKIRKRKYKNVYNSAFNEAFDVNNLYERALFVSPLQIDTENLYYVFPIDGYKFMFSENVKNSSDAYQTAFLTLFNNMGEEGIDTFSELMKYTYKNDSLYEGINSGAELIFYNISHCYGIKVKGNGYNELYKKLKL